MADRYLLESGAPDGYLLEDSSGVLLLEVVTAAHVIDGAVTVTVTPAAELVRGRVIDGAVTAAATPAATLVTEDVIAGAVPAAATPAAGLVGGDVIAGAVPVAATPAAEMTFTPAGGSPSSGGGGLPFADPRMAKWLRRKRARPPARVPDPEPIAVHLIGPDDDEFLATAAIAALLSEPW